MATHTSTGAYNATQAGFAPTNVLPTNVSGEIWKTALAESIFPGLAANVPVILGENVFPTLTKRPEASIVGEGGNKSDSEVGYGSKTMRPIKAVVGLEFTMEAVLQNPLGVLGLLQTELGSALSRQVDLAVAHGKEAATGNAITLTEDSAPLATSTNKVFLKTSADGGVTVTDVASPDAALWEGYGLIVNADTPHDFTGFALDPRFTFKIANERNPQTGQRVNPDIPMGGGIQSYAGLSVASSRTVSGQVGLATDSKIRGIGGDWSALKFGYSERIAVKKIEYGDPFGNGDLQRRNAVAYMAEVIFGFVNMDPDSFVLFVDNWQ